MNRLDTSSIRMGLPASRWLLSVLGALALVLPTRVVRVAAQELTAGTLPVVEPRLTRIIGSDTLKIVEPALSPDGRWVVFSTFQGVGDGYLWIVPSDGGEPRRLIESRRVRDPIWFPDGDRIAYWSGENSAVMSVAFDSRVGQVSGRPQRITLDPAASWFRLSPDARWIAYRKWSHGDDGMKMVINVVPSSGGTARAVGEPADLIFLMDWSADGRYIYYRAPLADAPDAYRTFRVLVDGGAPEEVHDPPTGESAPRMPYRIVRVSDGSTVGPPFEIQTYDGSPVARIALPENTEPEQAGRGFTADGTRLLTVVSNEVSPLRILPVGGGAPRQLGDARAPERPLGWSPDGSEILFATTLDGRSAIMSAPVAGGAAREVGPNPDRGPLPRDRWAYPITFSADGRYLAYSRPTSDSPDRTLVVRPVAGGDARVVTSALVYHSALRVVGPGGTPNIAGTDFLYLERNGDQAELRATPPEGPSRLIRSFATSEIGLARAKSVFENRVAYAHYPDNRMGGWGSADPTNSPPQVLVALGPEGTPKEVATVPGVVAFDDIVWSPDGRWIAAMALVATGSINVLVVGVTPEGDVTTPARLIDTPMAGSAWGLRWLPDGSAVTLYGQSLPDWSFDVWLVPIRDGGRPVSLTRDEQDAIGYNILSPDGRHIAYEALIQRGMSLWLADLGDALKR